jgi:hypothetical protein
VSLLGEIAVAYVVLAVLCALFLWALCMAAKYGDEQAEEALRRERQERKSRSDLGYWRGGHHS